MDRIIILSDNYVSIVSILITKTQDRSRPYYAGLDYNIVDDGRMHAWLVGKGIND
jgi:hypothetical protein